MKISFNWLKQYIALDISAEKTAELLTDCGLEVESVEKHESVKGGLAGCVIGEVKTKEKHPDADRLSVTTVDIGTGTLLHIVCGAANVAAGQKVVVATVGSTIYPVKGEPITLKKVKIRGATSEGMICAEDEVGLGESHSGIMVLDAKAKIGTPAKDYFKIEEDHLLEIGLTPNRGDAASHIGVAKDLYAVLNWKLAENKYELNVPSVENFTVENNKLKIDVAVEDKEACPRYSGVTISGITVKESPDWLKKRLQSIGLNPINNIVDATNFALHELGQPLHAFNAENISEGKVIVKKAAAGTKFTTLDGVDRTLTADDLMICSANEPLCLAGVLGGQKSGVTNETKNIFLESAYFSPVSIRKTSKHHGLKTDASFRFERGADPNITVYALQRAALLIKEVAGGNISSDIVDIYPIPIEEKKVSFSFHHCDRLIGKLIDRRQIKRILQLLGMEIINEGSDTLLLSVPTNRYDIAIEEDIIEEILRIYGCNDIEISSSVRSSLSYVSKPDTEKLRNTISDLLCGFGFTEIMSNSLTNAEYLSLLSSSNFLPFGAGGGGVVTLLNPLSPDLSILRPILLFSGLEAIAYNQNRKNGDLKLFEFGKTYASPPPAHLPPEFRSLSPVVPKGESREQKDCFFREESHLALFLCGAKNEESWISQQGSVDFFQMKAFVDNVLGRLGITYEQLSEMSSEILGSGLSYSQKNRNIVEFGFVKKSFLKKFDIKKEVFYADFNWDVIIGLTKNSSVHYKEIPKFPEVRRDLALVVDRNIKYELLESLAFQAEKSLLKNVNLFDVYEGDKIEQGKKSYALSFILQNENATLTDLEIDKVIRKLIKTYEEKAGAVIRS
ncbi:MAG: phenylalanine--tRNA ligase subunit beta [Bacteroidetes bacterium]|nr:MAG: phenylalanine--tRNA ligase subunit beta [Bacteroidota bacterium]